MYSPKCRSSEILDYAELKCHINGLRNIPLGHDGCTESEKKLSYSHTPQYMDKRQAQTWTERDKGKAREIRLEEQQETDGTQRCCRKREGFFDRW